MTLFALFVLFVGGGLSAYLLWADQNGRRVNKD
ncbi:hypothetical protein L602_001500000290 [Cupriavidus gilardii J11]|uniref:Uncharacterized protein n=1 Tax=Cupriavidus gilardii J11 TaxID=936133 RepID=A0A562BRI9_9BURK|nr:hypothetical protein L602_001500000290 [Cupriavidus gilardii J11]